ncbi:nucleotidyl transferase [Cellulomonas sp. APG4]|uniref:DUF6036 family nucleotidyltransferase n=1 Tax=Cellulomonas sp. APG4 TaxID=1538656 RepID=UPI00137B5B8E|nr:DUF6036 family nucleotidyltransferase [Cellulomonas sp. APG4]NCT90360.1 nucleotidyl transferase [Cellulomonas sp. APG4]
MAGPRRELTAAELHDLLTELGRRLHAKGVEATLYVVGGAAIALEMDTRRVTADVDAVFHPETTVREEAHVLAAERGLPRDWLNNSVAAFIPGGDTAAVPLDIEGIAVATASPQHLLAMKMASYRPGKDQADLQLLFDRLAITEPEQAADIALGVYGPYSVVLPDREELILSARAILDRRRTSGRASGGRGAHGRDSPGRIT